MANIENERFEEVSDRDKVIMIRMTVEDDSLSLSEDEMVRRYQHLIKENNLEVAEEKYMKWLES